MVQALFLGLTMAVTFDDLPAQGIERASAADARDINRRIVKALTKHRIPGIAFVNERGLETDGKVDPKRVAALELWLDAGLELGNHTYSHPSLHRVPLERYLREIADGERVIKPLSRDAGRHYGWFRHPFLQTGRDLETKRAVEAYLAEHAYRIAPVTIDNSEWIYARAYAIAHRRKDKDLKARLAASYLDYMMDVVAYYEKQSELLFGRQIPQVLLVHANRLNADHFDALAGRIGARGYRFVPIEDATADEAYRSEDTFTGGGGITWLHRWALTRGGMALVVPDEPTVPEFVEQVTE
jgi:peptidoglycan/xylan/chitin deacetylase (PgdA/CDA1 family)